MFRLSKFETFGWKISVNVDVFMFCIMGLLMIYYNMEIFFFSLHELLNINFRDTSQC